MQSDEPLLSSLHEIKSSLSGFDAKYAQLKQLHALQHQVDSIDRQLVPGLGRPGTGRKSLKSMLESNEDFLRLVRDRKGRACLNLEGDDVIHALMERKTTITSPIVGYQTTGVLQIERIPQITVEPRPVLKIRDLLSSRPTTLQIVDFVKVTTPPGIASPQIESSPKAENAVSFTSYSERVKMIATWIPATKQVLDDFQELAGYIETTLPYYVNLAEEQGLLLGDGTGENLHGLVPQATAFNTALLNATAGWSRIDVLGRAVEQIQIASEIDPDFVVLNPRDWWSLRLTKDSYGRYLLGDPQVTGMANVFGLTPVVTPVMSVGSFLVGTGSPVASEIRDRMSLQVEISTEHMDYFTRNMVAIRAEKRLALLVKRSGSFIYGSLNSSPVS
jgi:HK97 family phage major capsid protein